MSIDDLFSAIEADDGAAVIELLDRGDWLEARQRLADEIRAQIEQITAHHEGETLAATEAYLQNLVGDSGRWERTPLLHACRHGSSDSIRLLIERGADPDAKDLLGYCALEICRLQGGLEAVQTLLAACAGGGRKPTIDDDLYAAAVEEPALLDALLAGCELDQAARRAAFNLACATLDFDAVGAALERGYDPNDSRVWDRSPLSEAATSHLAWLWRHPQGKSLAPGYERIQTSQPLLYSGKDLQQLADRLGEMEPDELEAFLFGDDDDGAQPPDVGVEHALDDPVLQLDEQIDLRIELIDLLLAHGFDATKIGRLERENLLADLIDANEPRLWDKLVAVGVPLAPGDEELRGALALRSFRLLQRFLDAGATLPAPDEHLAPDVDAFLEWQAAR